MSLETLLLVTYRGIDASPALTERITKEASRLERFFHRMTSMRVVISRPHHHHRHGRPVEVHIEIGVPREQVVIHRHGSSIPTDPYAAVDDAFSAAQRRLEDYAQRLRGETKRHLE